MQREKYIKQRERLCKIAMQNPKKAAEELRLLAVGLENCRNTSDTINALCQIFAVSERTIFNDLVR
jgi:hypothetical protein